MKRDRSYRDSHLALSYGKRYATTYSHGYYFEQWNQLELPLLRGIFTKLSAGNTKSCLDFACGTGRILSIAEEYFKDTMGVDVSKPMLAYAKKTCPNSTLLKQDITKETIDKRFDLITAFRFFLNAEPQLRSEILTKFNKILMPEGHLITNCHVNSESILGRFYQLRNRLSTTKKAQVLSYREFKTILYEHNFYIEETHWYSYLPRTGWYLNWLSKKFMKPFEEFCSKTSIIPHTWTQSFLVVCRKNKT